MQIWKGAWSLMASELLISGDPRGAARWLVARVYDCGFLHVDLYCLCGNARDPQGRAAR